MNRIHEEIKLLGVISPQLYTAEIEFSSKIDVSTISEIAFLVLFNDIPSDKSYKLVVSCCDDLNDTNSREIAIVDISESGHVISILVNGEHGRYFNAKLSNDFELSESDEYTVCVIAQGYASYLPATENNITVI